jgi:YVTN family beta-propeller protein
VNVVADGHIGAELAGYRVEALLGRGGMSVVYRAEDMRLKRKVALKLLASELAEDERFRERFLHESELAASLDHPNIVPIYEAGDAQDVLYIAMRYVEGTDLKALLREQEALAPERALALVEQVADALDAAHARGLVHRDVKPSNVLISRQGDREHCYLADFGLTKSVSERSVLTDAGRLVGTVGYVAPEQIEGADVDGRADVYSLACLLYECLTGEVPFAHASEVAVIYAHLEKPPPEASHVRPELPAALDAVICKGMAKIPGERWPTCAALVAAARTALTGKAIVLPSRARLSRLAVATSAGALALAAALTSLFLFGGGSAVADADSLLRIDPAGATVTSGLALVGRPTAVTTCAGSVWVTSADGTVSQIEPVSSSVHRLQVSGKPTGVADVGSLAAVVTGPPRTAVTMIDAQFGKVSNVVRLSGLPVAAASAIAYGRDIWVANPNVHAVQRLDPPYSGVAATIPLEPRSGTYAGVAAGEEAVWVAGGRTLWRIDPSVGRVTATISLDFAPRAVAAGEGGIWLLDRRADMLVRMSPRTGALVARIPVGRNPVSVAAGPGSIWVANAVDRTVSRIDPNRNVVDKTIQVGSEPVGLAVGLGAVWLVRTPT